MQNETTHNKDELHRLIEKYTSHFIERVVCERELDIEQNCNILTPTLLAITAFLSRSPGLLKREPWGPASLGQVFIPVSSLQLVWSPNWLIGELRASSAGCWLSLPHRVSTDWISCALSYIIVQRPPSSCGRQKLHSFNASTVKVSLCYSSTGCTCYLHRCISYFNSPAGRRSIYNMTRVTVKQGLKPGTHNVQSHPLVEPNKIKLLTLLIKLGIIKIFLKALDWEAAGMIFSRSSHR